MANTIQQARQQVQTSQQQLRQVEQRLPVTTSQRSLRDKYSGLKGKIQRQQIEKVRSNIQQQKGILQQTEQKISEAEKQQAKYDLVLKEIQRKASGKTGTLLYGEPEAQKLYSEVLSKNPELKKAVQEGQTAVAEYRERSIESIREFINKRADLIKAGAGDSEILLEKITPYISRESQLELKKAIEENKTLADGVERIKLEKIPVDTFPSITEQQLVSSDKALKDIDVSKKDGYSVWDRIGAGVSDRLSNITGSDYSKSLARDIDISNISLGAAEGIQKVKETYDPSSGMFVSASPTGERATQYIRPPTIEEQEKIEQIPKSILDVKIVSPKYYGSKIGEFIREPSIIKDYFKEEPNVILDTTTGVMRYTTDKDYYKSPLTERVPSQYVITPRKILIASEQTVAGIGALGASAGGFIAEKAFKPFGEKIVSPKYYGSKIGEFIREPSIIKDYFKEEPNVILDTTTGVMRYTTDKDYYKSPLTERVPSQYVITEEKAKKAGETIGGAAATVGAYTALSTIPYVGIGLALAPSILIGEKYDFSPTKFWRESTVGEKVTVGLDVLGVGLGLGLKAKRIIKNKRINKAINTAIDKLDNVKLKSATYIDEATGRVRVVGTKKINGITQEVYYNGNIIKTESGVKFIPTGEGGTSISGIVDVKGQGKKYFGIAEEFEAGTKGGAERVGKFGDIEIFKEFSKTGIEPKRATFGITDIYKKGELVSKAELEKSLAKSFREITPSKNLINLDIPTTSGKSFISGELPKELLPEGIISYGKKIQIPDRPLFKLSETSYLRFTPEEVGTITIKKRPKTETRLGFQGGYKQSGKQFLENLYKQETKLDIPLPSPTKMAKQTATSLKTTPKIEPTGITPSIYAGTGQYETMQYTKVSPDILNIKDYSIIKSPTQIEQPDLKTQIKTFTDLKADIGIKQKQDVLSLTDLKMKEKTLMYIPSLSRIDIKTDLQTKVRTITPNIEAISPKVKTISRIPIKTKLSTPKQKPKPSKIYTPTIEEPLKIRRVIKTKRKTPEEFLAVTKRFGKEVIVAKGKDPLKVIQVGKGEVKRTLGATLKLKTTTGRQIGLTPTKEFRQSKTDPLAIVQRKEARLGTLGERREIKQAKKKGGIFSLR